MESECISVCIRVRVCEQCVFRALSAVEGGCAITTAFMFL